MNAKLANGRDKIREECTVEHSKRKGKGKNLITC